MLRAIRMDKQKLYDALQELGNARLRMKEIEEISVRNAQRVVELERRVQNLEQGRQNVR